MPVITSWFSTEPEDGINFNQMYAGTIAVPSSVLSTGNIDQAVGLVATDSLGTYREGTNQSHWVLVKASTTITQFNVIVFDDLFNANNFTSALALSGTTIALAQFQNYQGQTQTSADPSTNPVFWAAVKGVGMQVNASGSTGTGVRPTNSVTVAGSIQVTTTASNAFGTALAGLSLVASVGASGVVECIVNYPKISAI